MCKECLDKGLDRDNDGYEEFSELLKGYFKAVTSTNVPLFLTNVENLFDVFLENLPEEARQHYTCNACRHFINRFGGLVTISPDGKTTSAVWNTVGVPDFFFNSVYAMKNAVEKAKVRDVFITDLRVLGQPVTGEWTHMAVELPMAMVYRGRLKSAGEIRAEKYEEFKMVISALLEYPAAAVEKAITILEADALYRADRFLGIAQWFKGLHDKRAEAKSSKEKDNLVWLAVATAPTGFCHVKSSMIGTLLDDIVAGLPFETIKIRFEEKVHPSRYMRSQTPPSEGGIKQAEKVVEKLGIAESLRRRYASFDEIPQFIWKGSKVDNQKPAAGVFGNVSAKNKTPNNVDKVSIPGMVMTWEKFQKTLLPSAEKIEARIEDTNRLMAIVTASDPSAPNILHWDNTFSWYYHSGIDGDIKSRVEAAGGKYEGNEIRCSLVWEGHTDLDLHCETPNGKHICFSNKHDNYGGYLDVDANGCDGLREHPVENVRWEHAPVGNYKFYVHNYHERGKGTTPFKVELEINGQIYTHSGVARNTGWKEDVFNFQYQKGVQPNIANTGTSETSEDWNIPMNGFVNVTGITSSPNLWGENPFTPSGNHVFFLLEGCKDLSEGKGRGFFTEMLKPELKEIRKTLDAYTANTPIEEVNKATACGLGYSKDSEWGLTLKVTAGNSVRIVKIDRWD